MNDYLSIPTPAAREAARAASVFGLDNHGLAHLRRVYWNLPEPALYEEAVFRREGHIAAEGPFVVGTGKHTARAAPDKFVTREATSEEKVWWGEHNRPFTQPNFNTLLTRMQAYLQGRDVFVQDCYAGADPDHQLPIRDHHGESLALALRPRRCSRKPRNLDAYRKHVPEFTVICAPDFHASPLIDSTRTQTFIIVNFAARLAIIGGIGLRRRDQEDGLHGAELPAAARRRAADALLGQRRRGRRRRDLLRPLGDGQDDALRRCRRAG